MSSDEFQSGSFSTIPEASVPNSKDFPERNKPDSSDIVLQHRKRFQEWIAERKKSDEPITFSAIPKELLPVLIPSRVYEIASNPDNVEIVFASVKGDNNRESIQVIVAERKHQIPLSNKEAWEEWKKEKEKAKQSQSPGPKAPENIDRLHAEFFDLIADGTLNLEDRILFEIQLLRDVNSPLALYVSHYNGEIGQRIATEFYTNVLPDVARLLGFRYITGQNNLLNRGFFIDKLGRTDANSLTDEKFHELFPGSNKDKLSFLSVQFLYPKDKEKYVFEIDE